MFSRDAKAFYLVEADENSDTLRRSYSELLLTRRLDAALASTRYF